MEHFDKQTLLRYAAEHYNRLFDYDEDDFKKDFALFFITRKMIKRFSLKGVINHKLLLNNIVIAINVFGIEKTNVIFRTICDDFEFGCVRSCLEFLNCFTLIDESDKNEIIDAILLDVKNRYILGGISEINDNKNNFENSPETTV